MELGILGPLVVVGDGGRVLGVEGAKARAVLALLVTRANQVLTVDFLEDELWQGRPPPGARATVHAHISRLRQVLRAAGTAASIHSHRSAYRLGAEPAAIDAATFEQQLALATRAADPAARRRLLDGALGLWRGPALVDVGETPALALEAARLEELRLTATEERIAAALALGEHQLVVGELAALVGTHPYRERLHGQLMLALYRCDRQVEALRAYQAAHRVLTEQVGVPPGPALRALEHRIARQDPDLAPPGPWPVPVPQPPDPGVGPLSRRIATKGDPTLGPAGSQPPSRPWLPHRPPAPADAPHQCRRLLATGAAAHAAYDLAASLDAYRRALALAHRAGNAELAAEAACGLALAAEYRSGDGEVVELLRGILAELGPGFSTLRVKLQSALARSLPPADPAAVGLAGEALAAARQCGDAALVALATATQCLVAWGPDDAHARAERAGAAMTAAARLGWSELEAEAANWRAVAREEIGDRKGAAADAATVAGWAARGERPFLAALARMRATADALHAGDCARAAALLDAPHPAAAASPNFGAAALAQRFTLARLQGWVGELADALVALAADPNAAPAWRAAAAVGLAEAGRAGVAADLLATAVAARHQLPRDWLWLGAAVHLAEAAVALHDGAAAAVLDELLVPFTDRVAVLAHGVLRLGAVAGRRGELALVRGDPDAAERHLRTAIARNDRIGARPAAARARLARAVALRRRGRPGDHRLAARLTAEAAAVVDGLGLDGLRPALAAATATA